MKKSNENLNGLKEEETILPFPSDQVHEDGEDKITITLTAATLPPAKKQKLEEEISNLPQKQLEKSKSIVTSVRTEFELRNIRQGNNIESSIKDKLLLIIENNMSFRFSDIIENSFFKAFSVFDINLWSENDDDVNLKRDYEFLDEIHEKFTQSLRFSGYDLRPREQSELIICTWGMIRMV